MQCSALQRFLHLCVCGGMFTARVGDITHRVGRFKLNLKMYLQLAPIPAFLTLHTYSK